MKQYQNTVAQLRHWRRYSDGMKNDGNVLENDMQIIPFHLTGLFGRYKSPRVYSNYWKAFISNKSSQRKKGMAYSFYRNHILKIIFFFLIYPAKKEGTPLDRYETEKKSNSRCMRKSTCSKFEEIIWWWTCDNERNTAHMYKKVISETTGLFFDISCWCEEDRSMKYCCSRDDHITKEDQRIHSCWQSQDF